MTKKTTKKKSSAGRPTIMTPSVVTKLEQAFSLDCTVSEACFYAGISRETYYEFLRREPAFVDRFDSLRNKPVLKARQTVYTALKNPQYATWYLERKAKKEFSSRQELTGADGDKLIEPQLSEEEKTRLLSLLKKKK